MYNRKMVLVCSQAECKTGKIVVAKQEGVFTVIENFGDHQFCKPKSELPIDILFSLPEIREASRLEVDCTHVSLTIHGDEN